jgi:hypothetical protein
MLSPIFNLLIGRQIAVNDGLKPSEADRFGVVSMMIPNVFGIVVTKVLADREAAANLAAANAAASASGSVTGGAPAPAIGPAPAAVGPQMVTELPQPASAVQPVHEPGHTRHHRR